MANNNLSKAQNEAVIHCKGPMMVLAGPGSGKTFTMVRRIEYMIKNHKINPSKILVITFTKASAVEMQERFNKLMGEEYYPVTFGTFHAIYFYILKETYHYNSSNIITEKEKNKYLEIALKEVNPENIDTINYERILSDISIIKNEGMNPYDFCVDYMEKSSFCELYNTYKSIMRENQKVDFDDMVLLCYEYLKNSEDGLIYWRSRFEYFLIDEFQDINNMQYEVIKLLAFPLNNIFIVGDDDQSIYGFRGSKPEIMLNFGVDYPDVSKVILNDNYRSTPSIVSNAVNLIGNNKIRYEKNLMSKNNDKNEIVIKDFLKRSEELEYILRLIKTCSRNGNYNDIAILLRTNTEARAVTRILSSNDIPFRYSEKIKCLMDFEYVITLINIIRFANGENERSIFIDFMNKPVRYIRRDWIGENRVYLNKLMINNKLPLYVKQNISKLIYDLKAIKDMTLFATINYILKAMGLENYYKNKFKDSEKRMEEYNEVIKVVLDIAKETVSIGKFIENINEYDNSLINAAKIDKKEEAVNMVTMHSSKGLEYKTVILPFINEGYVPSRKALTEQDIEEERRVFYVAMTRAKNNLYITYSKNDGERKLIRSRFIEEIERKI